MADDGTVTIPWPTSSAPGERPQESAGRLVNCFIEPLQNDSFPQYKAIYKRTPGLTSFSTTGRTGFRGAWLVKSLVYASMLNRLITVDGGGAATDVGVLSGTKPVTFAHNEKQPNPDVVVVTENGAFVVTPSTITPYPDPDLPQPNSVSFQDGFFFFTIGDRRAFASDINDTSVNSQTFTTMESRAGGALLRAVPYIGLMYFFCETSLEVYANAAATQAAPKFPYSRLQVIDRGLLTSTALAGHEPGFGHLAWVADDFGVYRLGSNGLVPEKISPPSLDRLIQALPDKTQLWAGVHQYSGRRVWTIRTPFWCWEFDLNTEKWHERWSTNSGLILPSWRGLGGSIFAFNKWLIGSDITGNIGYADPTSFFEEGTNIQWRMESGPVGDFPRGARVARADFDFVTGVGIPGGSASQQAPQVAISWSDDGGTTWGNPVMRSLGAGQQSKTRVTVFNPGRTLHLGRRWRIDVVDGVFVGFLGATMSRTLRGL